MTNDTSHIALAALHHQTVAHMGQLDMLAARSRTIGEVQRAERYDELSDQALMAYVELKRRWAG
jgi:hypothetical protein